MIVIGLDCVGFNFPGIIDELGWFDGIMISVKGDGGLVGNDIISVEILNKKEGRVFSERDN
jgi:hypothetical protein